MPTPNKGPVPPPITNVGGAVPPPPLINDSPNENISQVALGNSDDLTEVPLLVPSQPSTPVSSSSNGMEGVNNMISDLSLTTPTTTSDMPPSVPMPVNPVINSTTPTVLPSTEGTAVQPAVPTYSISQFNPSQGVQHMPPQGGGATISQLPSLPSGGVTSMPVVGGVGAVTSTMPVVGGASISQVGGAGTAYVPQVGVAGMSQGPLGPSISYAPVQGGGTPFSVHQLPQGGTSQSFHLPYGGSPAVGVVTMPSNMFPSSPPTISLTMPTSNGN